MPAARLLYVMDPMCSWCWGFAPVINALAEQANAAGVATEVVVGGLRREQMALEPSLRGRILEHWQAVQQRTGQDFDFSKALPEGFIYDTEPACRALVCVRELEPASVWPLLMQIQSAFYRQGRDVTQASVLCDLAERAGIARIEFADAFDARAAHEATQADFNWVQRLGIAGFPTVLAERDGQLSLLTNGYQSFEQLSPLLGRWLEHLQKA